MKSNGFPYLTDTLKEGCETWPECGCPIDRCDADDVMARPLMVVVLTMAVWALLLLTLVAIAMGVVGVVRANAHQAPSGWSFPMACCSNRDCGTIPASRVKEGPNGYEVTLLPGDHDFITAKTGPRSYVIPYAETKDSPDGEYHICLLPTSLKQLCFFAGSRMG